MTKQHHAAGKNTGGGDPFAHPLDPLTADEIATASMVVKTNGGISRRAWFETIALHEPDKAAVRKLDSSDKVAAIDRRAYVCCYDPQDNRTLYGVVNVTAQKLESWQAVKDGGQARIVADEYFAAEIGRAHV